MTTHFTYGLVSDLVICELKEEGVLYDALTETVVSLNLMKRVVYIPREPYQ